MSVLRLSAGASNVGSLARIDLAVWLPVAVLWLLVSGLTSVLNLPLTSDDRARCHFRGADFARVRVPRLTGVYPRASNVAELAALLCSGPASVLSAGVTSAPSPFSHARHPMLRRLRTECAEPHLRPGAAGTRTLLNIYRAVATECPQSSPGVPSRSPPSWRHRTPSHQSRLKRYPGV